MQSIIFDIECDGFAPKNIWCIGMYHIETSTYELCRRDKLNYAVDLLNTADLLIGHNIKIFDLRVIERLLNKAKIDREKCFDTLEIAKHFFPDKKQKLADWGEFFNMPKTQCDFRQPSQQMYDYCLNDVKITKLLYDYILSHTEEGYAAIAAKKPRCAPRYYA